MQLATLLLKLEAFKPRVFFARFIPNLSLGAHYSYEQVPEQLIHTSHKFFTNEILKT
jgi:hypothetical protein